MAGKVKNADVAETLFGDAEPPTTGMGCTACRIQALGKLIDDCLLGMLGEGPYAGKVPIFVTVNDLHRRLSDPERARKAGVPHYPKKLEAFRVHLHEHRAELLKRVKAAKQAAGY